jgi:hypothetical protein
MRVLNSTNQYHSIVNNTYAGLIAIALGVAVSIGAAFAPDKLAEDYFKLASSLVIGGIGIIGTDRKE